MRAELQFSACGDLWSILVTEVEQSNGPTMFTVDLRSRESGRWVSCGSATSVYETWSPRHGASLTYLVEESRPDATIEIKAYRDRGLSTVDGIGVIDGAALIAVRFTMDPDTILGIEVAGGPAIGFVR